MSVVLIVGDVHLGKSISIGKPGVGSALNSRVVDQFNLLEWILDQAIINHVETIILTGDICEDIKPDYILIELFVDWLKKCVSHNMDVHIIAGNHDLKRTGTKFSSYLDLLSTLDIHDVHVYKNIDTIMKSGVGFTLLPFRDRQSLDCQTNEEALNKIATQLLYEAESISNDCSKVLIGHLALAGSIFVGDEFDNLSRELMCPLGMFTDYDYVWMGHVHKPQTRQKKNPYIAHVGSLDISDFGETDHQKVIILFDNDLPEKFKEIPVPSRPLRRVVVDVPEGFDSTDYVINKINAMHKKTPFDNAIVRVEIKLLDKDTVNVNREEIESCIYNLGAFFICTIQESRNISVMPIIQQAIDNKMAPKAAIKIYAETQEFNSSQGKQKFIDLASYFVDVYSTR